MFIGYGLPVVDERLRYYGNLTQHVPIEVFKCAVERSVTQHTGNFPPSVGAILSSALALAPGELNPGHERSLPAWFRKALNRQKVSEQPKEIGYRSGPQNIVDTIIDKKSS